MQPTAVRAFKTAIRRRQTGYPLAYILKEAPFRERLYAVQPGVLIPRADTEIVVETAIAKINEMGWTTQSFSCIELGYGTGIISLELALAFPTAAVWGWDISVKAHQTALENKSRHQVSNATFFKGDFFKAQTLWEPLCEGPTLFVSNPPYIAPGDPALAQDVAQFEPQKALYGGKDGLLFYKKSLEVLATFQTPWMAVFEIGFAQKAPLIQLLGHYPHFEHGFVQDNQGLDRVLWVDRRP